MINKQWLPVPEYECCYEVCTDGHVRSVTRVVKLPNGKTRKIKGKLLKQKHTSDGYLFVSLSKNGFTRTCYIHRLVATAFLLNPERMPEVNHKNGDKTCNTLNNLEWVTHPQNLKHAYDNNLSKNKGGSHAFAAGVIDNTLGKTFATVSEWCKAREISYSTGRNILNGQKSRRIDLTGVHKITKTNE